MPEGEPGEDEDMAGYLVALLVVLAAALIAFTVTYRFLCKGVAWLQN